MIRVGLASVRGHLTRFIMSAFAVALGVAFVTGTFIFSDGLSGMFDRLVGDTTQGTDVVVRGKALNENDSGFDQGTRPLKPLSYADELATIDGVAKAVPNIQGSATLIGKNGTAVRQGGAPTLAFPARENDPVAKLVDGKLPKNANEIALEDTTFEQSGYNVGDTAEVIAGAESKNVTITGVIDSGESAGAAIVFFDVKTAEKLFAPEGTVAEFSLTAEEGLTQQELRDRVAGSLDDTFEAITGKEANKEIQESIGEALKFITVFLMVFAIVALVVGSFIIVNTFLMLLAQRSSELAMLRAIGTRKRQVVAMVMVEALAIGVLGAILGFGLGILLAQGIAGLMKAFVNLEVSGGLDIKARTVIWAFVIGIGVTLIAALFPAIRASRTAPVAAMSAETATARKSLLPRGIIALTLLVLAGILGPVGLSLEGDARNYLVIGAIVAGFLGFVIGAAAAVQPIIGVLTAPAAAMGSVPELARDNTVRNPRRTALTASALMIGLALVSGVGVLASSATASTQSQVNGDLNADYVVASGFDGVPPGLADKLGTVDGVDSVEEVSSVQTLIGDDQIRASGINPKTLNDSLNLSVVSGSAADLGDGKIGVEKDFAEDEKWSVGDTITADVGTLREQTYTIAVIYEQNSMLADVLLPASVAEKAVPDSKRFVFQLYVNAKDGVDTSALKDKLVEEVKDLKIVSVQTKDEYRDSASGQLNTILQMIYALLGLSIVIAALGIANTLAMSLFERTREIGMLRAIGLKRGQLWRMVILESLWTATFGAILGVVMGLGLGILGQRYLAKGFGLEQLGVPWGTIVVVLVLAALVGVLSALVPAFRASRIKPLEAIAS